MSTLDDFLKHPIDQLEKALHIRKHIAQLEEVLKELMGPSPISLAGVQIMQPKRKGKRTMSAAARARIAAAQRARWAKSKGSEPKAESAPVAKAKKKGGMSAAGRARVAAAQKARWAAVKAQKSTSMPGKPELTPVNAAAKKKKRKISAAHRAKLIASAKARWAKVKKGKS